MCGSLHPKVPTCLEQNRTAQAPTRGGPSGPVLGLVHLSLLPALWRKEQQAARSRDGV